MDPDRSELLRQSADQFLSRTAVDVVRLIDPCDGRTENQLYTLAVRYLVTYFGGAPDDATVDPDDDP